MDRRRFVAVCSLTEHPTAVLSSIRSGPSAKDAPQTDPGQDGRHRTACHCCCTTCMTSSGREDPSLDADDRRLSVSATTDGPWLLVTADEKHGPGIPSAAIVPTWMAERSYSLTRSAKMAKVPSRYRRQGCSIEICIRSESCGGWRSSDCSTYCLKSKPVSRSWVKTPAVHHSYRVSRGACNSLHDLQLACSCSRRVHGSRLEYSTTPNPLNITS